MKLFYIGPIVPADLDPAAVDERLASVVAPIADLVHSYLKADTFAGLIGLQRRDLVGRASDAGSTGIGDWRAVRFESEGAVVAALRNMGDATVPSEFAMIRSIISCRAVTYGYDAQAFLCLRIEDEAPLSPDPSTIIVEERPDLLLEIDYLDGAEAAVDLPWTDDP